MEESGKKTKQEITVPFLWEEKPGQPKKDWVYTVYTPKQEPVCHVPQAPKPVTYIASIPFKWEEKPGTPLVCFTQESKEHHSTTERSETVMVMHSSLPLPPAYFAKLGSESDGDSSYGDDYGHDSMSELDFEGFSVLSDESFCFAPLLEQADVPPQNQFLIHQNDAYMEGLSSSEDNSSPRSYASRNTSLRGAAFLHYLFPLYPPKSGLLDKPDDSEKKENVQSSTELNLPNLEEHKKQNTESQRSGAIRRPLTLQELIIERRKKSCRRKAIQSRKTARKCIPLPFILNETFS